MKTLKCVVAGLVSALVLGGCASAPLTGQEALSHVLFHDVAIQCVRSGMVRDMAATERLISKEASIIQNRISAAEQAAARSEIRRLSPAFPAVTREHCNMADVAAARVARESTEQAQQRQRFNDSMTQLQQQTAAANASRPRQTICTNLGGGMAACNSY